MPEPRAHDLIKYMDMFGVDVCFALRESMMDVAGYSMCMSTNAFIMKEIEPYKDRMYLECNCGPILRRGVDNAIWELEYLVKNADSLGNTVYRVPLDIDQDIARLKLASMGVAIDTLTPEQEKYLKSWEMGT